MPTDYTTFHFPTDYRLLCQCHCVATTSPPISIESKTMYILQPTRACSMINTIYVASIAFSGAECKAQSRKSQSPIGSWRHGAPRVIIMKRTYHLHRYRFLTIVLSREYVNLNKCLREYRRNLCTPLSTRYSLFLVIYSKFELVVSEQIACSSLVQC